MLLTLQTTKMAKKNLTLLIDGSKLVKTVGFTYVKAVGHAIKCTSGCRKR